MSTYLGSYKNILHQDETLLGTDIGQGPTYSKYTLEYLIVCLLADQSGNQQILLNGGSIKLPLNV